MMHLTWTIWSSFLIDSRLGPEDEDASPLSGVPVASCLEVASEPVLRCPPMFSLGLFVRVGFVWGDEAGEDTLGGCRDC